MLNKINTVGTNDPKFKEIVKKFVKIVQLVIKIDKIPKNDRKNHEKCSKF